MRAAIYLRVSTARQAGEERVSLDVQRERCLAFCHDKGWEVIAIETDTESGLKATRTGYQRILALARAHELQHVVVLNASRFGRRASEVLARVEELRDMHGVELHSTQEDLSSFLMVGITAVINEETSRSIARLAAPAKLARARDGYWMAHAPYGTTNDHGVLKPGSDFDVLEGIFERAAAGASVRQITLWVNSLSDRQRSREGLRDVIRNTAYLGMSRWAGEEFPGRWEPLINPALWHKAQTVVRQRRTLRAGVDAAHPHWILGLAYCGACGARMSRLIRLKGWGTQYEYLRCNRRDYKQVTLGCGAKMTRLRPFQDRVLEELRGYRFDGADMRALRAELREREALARREMGDRARALQASRSKLTDRLARAREGYLDRVYDATEYHRLTAGLKEEVARLDEQLANLEPAGVTQAYELMFGTAAWLDGADQDPQGFRAFLGTFIERIEVPLRIVWRAEAEGVLTGARARLTA